MDRDRAAPGHARVHRLRMAAQCLLGAWSYVGAERQASGGRHSEHDQGAEAEAADTVEHEVSTIRTDVMRKNWSSKMHDKKAALCMCRAVCFVCGCYITGFIFDF